MCHGQPFVQISWVRGRASVLLIEVPVATIEEQQRDPGLLGKSLLPANIDEINAFGGRNLLFLCCAVAHSVSSILQSGMRPMDTAMRV